MSLDGVTLLENSSKITNVLTNSSEITNVLTNSSERMNTPSLHLRMRITGSNVCK